MAQASTLVISAPPAACSLLPARAAGVAAISDLESSSSCNLRGLAKRGLNPSRVNGSRAKSGRGLGGQKKARVIGAGGNYSFHKGILQPVRCKMFVPGRAFISCLPLFGVLLFWGLMDYVHDLSVFRSCSLRPCLPPCPPPCPVWVTVKVGGIAGFGEKSPEAKSADSLHNFFTFTAVKIVLSQLQVGQVLNEPSVTMVGLDFGRLE